jgi:hypothetical protein
MTAGMSTAFAAILLAACGGGGTTNPPPVELPPWDPGLPAASVMQMRRGLEPVRGIIHLHSPYSHDACDGAPRAPDGTVDETCLERLRDALCATAMDFAALTDHDDSMADEAWGPELFLHRDGDELVTDDLGAPIANRIACDGGGRVLVMVGGENDLMPLMLDGHPAGDATSRHAVYNGNDAATVNTFRSLGGLVWVAHSESKDLGLLRELRVDGLEIYNLHAAIDPDIREEWLGLDGPEAIMRVVEFADQEPTGPEPDLALLSILEPNRPSVAKWNALLGDGSRIVGTAGTDAHENALPILLRDGERGDSYRRMLRWFSNVVLVDDPQDPRSIESALAFGRSFVAFELLGTPVGFDFWADLSDGTRVELGGEVRVADAPTLVAVTPHVHDLSPDLPEPAIRTVIVRADAMGVEEVAVGQGAVQVRGEKAGAYRVEVRMTPRHLGPYLGTLGPGYAEVEQVWVYSNPIYVRP